MESKVLQLLLVEDDKVDQMAFERFVKREKLAYNYTIAGSVAEASEILKSASFDIIISDYLLGDGTSFELFPLYEGTPVVITTGSGDEDVAISAMKLGASDYLIKDPEGNYLKVLPTTVGLALKRKQNEDELQKYHDHLEAMVIEQTIELRAEIDERKKMAQRYQELVEGTTDLITQVDSEGRFLYINHMSKIFFGSEPEELIGQNSMQFIHPEDLEQSEAWFTDCLERQVFQGSMETRQVNKVTGDIHELLWTVNFHYDGQGKPLSINGIAHNVTEMKKLQNQLLQSQKMEAVGLMAGGMAHNFNNNLSIILGNIELVNLKTQQTPEISELLNNAKIGVMRSRDLIMQVMEYSRIGAQNSDRIQLAAIVDESQKLLRSTIPSTICLQYQSLSDNHSITIYANATRIQEALFNICNNAVHAMEEQGTLTITVEVVDVEKNDIPAQFEKCIPGNYAVVAVQDTGHGMTRAVSEKIFDPFFTTKEVNEGTGMGLATVYGLLNELGGMIKIDSIPGQGTIFRLYFPIISEQIDRLRAVDFEPLRGSECILFVDDEELLADLAESMLTELGYRVITMTESTEALKLFSANIDQIDLVITDQTMPTLSGKDLIQELLKIKPDLPTILCTGFSSKIDKTAAMALGIKDFLMKPLDLRELSLAVRRVLDGVEPD